MLPWVDPCQISASEIDNQWHFNQQEIDIWMKNQRPNKGGSQPEELVFSEATTDND